MITVDFETEAIVGNPIVDPPAPVGVAVTYPNMESHYYTGVDMWEKCHEIWGGGQDILFHNAPFDL